MKSRGLGDVYKRQHRMAAWANDVCGASLWPKPELHASNVLFFMVAKRMISALQCTPDLDVSDARAMILFLLWLQSDSYTAEEQQRVALCMLRFGLHSAIRQCILTFPKEATEECVALLLRPLVLFPEPTTEFTEKLDESLSLIHISEPTRLHKVSRMPSSA